MQPSDIWQIIGSPQIAEITALASTAIAVLLNSQDQKKRNIALCLLPELGVRFD